MSPPLPFSRTQQQREAYQCSPNPYNSGNSDSSTSTSTRTTNNTMMSQTPRLSHPLPNARSDTATSLTTRLPTTSREPTAPHPIQRYYIDARNNTNTTTPIEPFYPVNHHSDSASSTGSTDDSYFLVLDAAEVATDETYDPRRWERRPAPTPAEALGAVRRRVAAYGEGVVAGAAGVLSAGAAVMSVGTADGMGDLVREARGMWTGREAVRRVDSVVEGEEEKEESEEESGEGEVQVWGLRVVGEEGEASTTQQDGDGGDGGSSSDGEDTFVDAPDGSTANDSSPPIQNHDERSLHRDLVDVDLSSSSDRADNDAADFDLITDHEADRIYDLNDVSPHMRRALRAHQHHPRRPAEALIRPATTTATMTTRAEAAIPAAPHHHHRARTLASPPSPRSSPYPMISERVDELPQGQDRRR